jgi:hypothetical protein
MLEAIGKAFKMKDILKIYEGREQEYYRLKLVSIKKDFSLKKITRQQFLQIASDTLIILSKIDKLTAEELELQKEIENKSLGEMEKAENAMDIKKIISKM